MAEPRLTDLEERLTRVERRQVDLDARLTRNEVMLGAIERAIDNVMLPDPHPTQQDLIPAGDGQKLAEVVATVAGAREKLRGARESVKNMRRVIDPNDVTGAHKVGKDE